MSGCVRIAVRTRCEEAEARVATSPRYCLPMIEIEVKGGAAPEALAELIASTLHGIVVPDASLVATGKRVREEKEHEEVQRPSVHDLETTNFQTIDDDLDWSEL